MRQKQSCSDLTQSEMTALIGGIKQGVTSLLSS